MPRTAGAMASCQAHTFSCLLLAILCYEAAAVARVVQLVAGNFCSAATTAALQKCRIQLLLWTGNTPACLISQMLCAVLLEEEQQQQQWCTHPTNTCMLAENPSPFVSANPDEPKFIVSLFDDGKDGSNDKPVIMSYVQLHLLEIKHVQQAHQVIPPEQWCCQINSSLVQQQLRRIALQLVKITQSNTAACLASLPYAACRTTRTHPHHSS